MKEQPAAFERFGAQWTPTILLMDSEASERHRVEGFLPKEDFLAQLRIGLAHAARSRGDFADAERRYRELSSGEGDVAAESLYWAGVSRYKHSNERKRPRRNGQGLPVALHGQLVGEEGLGLEQLIL